MTLIRTGNLIIGLGKKITCPRCSNDTVQLVSVYYNDAYMLLWRINKIRGSIKIYCQICHHIFFDNPDSETLFNILNSGKDYTKLYYERFEKYHKILFLKELRILKLDWLADYISK